MAEPTSEQTAWDQWFDGQYDVSRCVDRAVKELSEGKSDGFRVAMYAGIIEHCAEAMRTYVALEPDAVEEAAGG